MVDIPPPPPRPPPVPPEELGPDVHSAEWKLVQANKNKRKDFGAGIGFVTEEKIRQFHLELTVNAELGPNETVPNLYELHREFIEKLLTLTDGDTHITPTAKNNNPSNGKTTTQSPILSVQGFPTTDFQHRKFFHRYIRFNPQRKNTLIRIHHEVLMKETVAQAKAKLLEWLKSKNMYMKAGDLNAVETSGFGWMLSAHPNLVFKPDLSRRLNQLVAEIPKDILEAQIDRLGSKEDLLQLPTLYVNSKEQALGVPPGRVATQAVTISCVKNRIRLMKELVSLIPLDVIPYTFIPIGLATMENPDVYQKFIILNNDRQNEVQGIIVKGFSNELLNRHTDPRDTKSQLVVDYLLSHKSVVSIQETHQTTEHGKYIIIVYKEAFQDARNMLTDFCVNRFKKIYSTQEQQDDYRVSNKSLPHIANAPTAGGAAATHGAHLVAMMAEQERKNGKAFSSLPNDTWASKVSTHFSFDKNSKHPIAQKSAAATVASTPSAVTATSTTVTPSATTSPSPATVSNADNNSVISGSTLAPATQATLSGRSLQSNDLNSVISRMETIATEQSKLFEKLFDKQERQARRAAKVAALHNQQMMQIIIDMINNKQPTITTPPRKPKRMSQEEHQEQSIMWKQSSKNKNRPAKAPESPDRMECEEPQTSDDDNENYYNNAESETHDEDDAEDDDADDDEDSSHSASDDNDASEDITKDEDTSSDSDSRADYGETDSDDYSAAESNMSVSTDTLEEALSTKHERALTSTHTRTQTHNSPTTNRISKWIPTTKTHRSPPKTMSSTEAQLHAASVADAKKAAQAARHAKIQELHSASTPKISNDMPSSPAPLTPTRLLMNNSGPSDPPAPSPQLYPPSIHGSSLPPPPPPPAMARTRQRSPGHTPDNESKLQRTGKAPVAPTTQDETARTLNFEDKLANNTIMEEPDPPPTARSRLE